MIKIKNILIISQRFDDTELKYFKSSPWALSMFASVSSTFASILQNGITLALRKDQERFDKLQICTAYIFHLWTCSSCIFTMLANCWNIPPSSTMVDSMLSIAVARDCM